MRRSTISSCFDDTDNTLGKSTRGSLPIVLLDSWQELTKERLEKEWENFKAFPLSHWDWRRVFMHHWLERINC
jgi:3'-phosphoadenosine 5'-phosphosulfate sulfotransferase (PAPS reductase)/FAD synthetase